MRKFLTIIIALCLWVSASAQKVPGYRGLKFSVKYDFGIMHQAILGQKGKMPLMHHQASLDYVVARYVTVGLKYGFLYHNFPQPLSYRINAALANKYTNTYTQHTISFIVKRFYKKKGYIAPVGRYMLFGVYYQYANMHSYRLDNIDGFNNANTSVPIIGIAHMGGVSWGVGRTFVIANRILLDMGFQINVPLGIPSNYNYEELMVYRQVALKNLLQFKIGIGALAF